MVNGMDALVMKKERNERPATAVDVDELMRRIPWLVDVFPDGELHRRVEESLAARRRLN